MPGTSRPSNIFRTAEVARSVKTSHPQAQLCHYLVSFASQVSHQSLDPPESIRLITYGPGAIWSCTSPAAATDLPNADGLLRLRIWRRTPTGLAMKSRRAGEKASEPARRAQTRRRESLMIHGS